MESWVLLRKGADFQAISEKFHISPRIASLIRNREIIGDEAIDRYLNGTIADLYDGMLMKDMDKAVAVLMEKIKDGSKIRIIGDYDIDGIQSTYILMKGLAYLKADVDSDIPDRMKDGYGLNRHLIERALDADVDTIVTCDNGIAASEEIDYAKSLGMTVIVTDHHEVPYEDTEEGRRYLLPPADAVVDPKREDCPYPFKGLCGAAVAYKLTEALCEAMGADVDDIDYLMENVAIATVGDVMDLVDENRIFVKQGLEMLKRTQNKGLKALIACTGVDVERLSAYHIGFVLGPCMNASGRLDTAKRALELLEADNSREADVLAGDLKALNDSRKDMTAAAVEEAFSQVETTPIYHDRVLVIYLPNCHESLAGIVAGRVREKYYKPVFVLTKAAEGLKGSGRSIESWHMYEGLNRCRNLLSKFGGHKMAAGLSLPEENLAEFRKAINDTSGITEEDLVEKVSIDMQLPFCNVTEGFVKELGVLEPYGKANPKPVFAERKVEVKSARVLGKNRNVLKMRVKDTGGTEIDAIYFGNVEDFLAYIETAFGERAQRNLLAGRGQDIYMSFTYYPDINEYQGIRTPQIVVQNYK
ncbi:single-stranded-DNA-specific exonuclease RecJ [Bariatricus massiliensis]|uniref:Single-stranded-DNA-specific exonuclease RecJ n=1 Tax=Bariatricus massiliensis TaxID=1745713 RepID=A0ABS8DF06_9FIRM|nr:single-stranded-DNA-specific exonuclease RecJ [Bariatricus massiliensis]MCB7303107.1 single-stranded-DNA-specific exonuclease RecJ [Bariatricus massiliensis]MCB7374323.1 single-stranded-DNA-specific exonuclease RecJ [Bariatricus massiliensis]MCB7386993.1 single-stranded-DNA-specific exonuclease RecJ [Bariatricus massiliensis]MCB7411155.1 single-stranded-DNA-specific exonuclease RecJ [Bariatricus massiliensis]MCQ5251981.1 single-stranded-DNA-specific exonuclease RecJ [Bariatricus massiliensi